MLNFCLAGNPNSGKTTLFNALTGSTAHVGNWPGVTVDKREGVYKKLEEKINIVDLPGIYSLSPYTLEEVVSRNYIMEENPDLIINIVDATKLERNLYLTTQLLETNVPMVIALNMIDAVEKAGDKIDVRAMEKAFGVPVIEISALRGKNINELMKVAYQVSKTPRRSFSVVEHSPLLGKACKEVELLCCEHDVDCACFHAIKVLEGDLLEVGDHPHIEEHVQEIRSGIDASKFDGDIEAMVADARYLYITSKMPSILKKGNKNKGSASVKADKVLTHKVWGIPIFLLIMLSIFHVTFGEDFLYLGSLFGLELNSDFWCTLFQVEAGSAIPSPGVWLQSWFGWLTGSLIDLVRGWMETSPAWLTGLVCDGLLSGIDAILSFLPHILMLFLFLSILEDTGYMSRVAFIMDRVFRKFGLSGKAFYPLLMCFGCGVPGVMGTKILESEKERKISLYISPFFSCGAKLPIWLVFAGVLFGGQYGDLVVYTIYLSGIVVAIISALILKFVLKKEETAPFIMELPDYHCPQLKNLMLHLWDKLEHYLVKAGTIIASAIVVIWFLSNFGFAFWNGMVDDINVSMLGQIGQALQYLFYPMGWAMGDFGWQLVVSALTGLLAKEEIVATMAVLAGGDVALELVISSMTVPAAFSFMLFNLLCIPCMAMVGAVAGELRSGKELAKALAFWMGTAYIVSALTYWCFTYWYIGVAVAVGIVALLVVLYIRYKKHMSNKVG